MTVYPPTLGWLRRLLVVGVVVGMSVPTARAQVVQVDRLVAVVESRALTASDLRLATRLGSIPGDAADEDGLVEQLVARELMRAEADRFAVAPPSEQAVTERLTAMAAGWDPAVWRAQLASLGASSERIRRVVADDLRIAAYLDQRFTNVVQPTDTDVRARAALGPESSPAALAAARETLTAERREVLISDWLAGLRRRAAIRVVTRP